MINNLKDMKGIIPALITPYTHEGSISEPVTRQLVKHLLSKGIVGLYLCGSTGEGFLQNTEERKYLLEIVLDEVQDKVPVISHVGAMDTATCVDLTIHAEKVGASAVSAVTPFYYKHSLEQIKQHYIDIVRAADIPLIIYHFPNLTGATTPIEFYHDLSEVDGIIGLKFSSRDVFQMQQLIGICDDEFLVYNGPDEICIAGLTMGACGAIGSTYNIMPEMFVKLYHEFMNGNIPKARELQYKANKVIHEMSKYGAIAFEREILRLQGFEVGNPRKPLQQITTDQRKEIHQIARSFSFLHVE